MSAEFVWLEDTTYHGGQLDCCCSTCWWGSPPWGWSHHAAVAFLLTRAKTGPSLLHLSECWPQVTLVTGPVETLLATPLVTPLVEWSPIGDGRWAGRGRDLVSRNHVIILLQLASLSICIFKLYKFHWKKNANLKFRLQVANPASISFSFLHLPQVLHSDD